MKEKKQNIVIYRCPACNRILKPAIAGEGRYDLGWDCNNCFITYGDIEDTLQTVEWRRK